MNIVLEEWYIVLEFGLCNVNSYAKIYLVKHILSAVCLQYETSFFEAEGFILLFF